MNRRKQKFVKVEMSFENASRNALNVLVVLKQYNKTRRIKIWFNWIRKMRPNVRDKLLEQNRQMSVKMHSLSWKKTAENAYDSFLSSLSILLYFWPCGRYFFDPFFFLRVLDDFWTTAERETQKTAIHSTPSR